MAKITNNVKRSLLHNMKLDNITNERESITLGSPHFDNVISVDYLAAIAETDLTIKNIITYEDVKIVWGNTKKQGVIAIFDDLDNLLLKLVEIELEPGVLIPMPLLKELNINNDGLLYGLEQDDKGNVYFFQINDIITQAQQNVPLDAYYSIRFDVSTETKVDLDGKALSVFWGNPIFKTYGAIDFSQDQFDNNTYAFALWNDIEKKIRIVRFSTALGNVRQADVGWIINEWVSFDATHTIPAEFSNISNLGIKTGDVNIKQDVQQGSLLVMASSGSQSQSIPYKKSIPFNFSNHMKNQVKTRTGGTDYVEETETIISNQDFVNMKSEIYNILMDPQKNITDYSIDITLRTRWPQGSSYNFTFNKDWIDEVDNGKNKTLDATIMAKTATSPFQEYRSRMSINDSNMKDIFVWNHIWANRYGSNDEIIDGLMGSGKRVGSIFTSYDFDVEVKLNLKGFHIQLVAPENSAQQIVMSKLSGVTETQYLVNSIENDTYGGNKPVAITSTNFYVPLRSAVDGNYYIFEFNGNKNKPTKPIDRFIYRIAQVDGYKLFLLLNASSVTEVLVDDSVYTDWKLKSPTEIELYNLTRGQRIIIKYKSLVNTPDKLNVVNTTQSDDFYLAGINNKGELPTNSISVVGAGNTQDLSSQTGLNLYQQDSDISLDAVAEDVQQIQGFKISHVVVYRQKNALWILAYNASFTRYLQWVQIYPESTSPYTYKAHSDTQTEYVLERFNCNKDGLLKNTRFDRELLNVSISSNTIVATTIAGDSDLDNQDNNKIQIFGHTNKLILEDDITITKSRIENKTINVTLQVSVLDQLSGSNTKNIPASNSLAAIFVDKNRNSFVKGLPFGFYLKFDDGTNGNPIPVSDYITIDDAAVKAKFETTIIPRDASVTKKPIGLVFVNGEFETMAEADLSNLNCNTKTISYSCDIVFEETP